MFRASGFGIRGCRQTQALLDALGFRVWGSACGELSGSLCEGRTSFCTGLISRKLCSFLLMFSTGFTSLSILLLFPLSITNRFFSSFLCTVFNSISSNIDDVLSINPSANVFAFGDFNFYHKDWLTYSGGTDRPGELCYNFFYLR